MFFRNVLVILKHFLYELEISSFGYIYYFICAYKCPYAFLLRLHDIYGLIRKNSLIYNTVQEQDTSFHLFNFYFMLLGGILKFLLCGFYTFLLSLSSLLLL